MGSDWPDWSPWRRRTTLRLSDHPAVGAARALVADPGRAATLPFDVGTRISDNAGRNSAATDRGTLAIRRVPAAELRTSRPGTWRWVATQPEESR